MARLSKEERAELEARLADDDADDDDEQVTVSIGDRSFTGSLRRARDFATAHGFSLTPAPKTDDDDAKPKNSGSNVKRFNAGRRTG